MPELIPLAEELYNTLKAAEFCLLGGKCPSCYGWSKKTGENAGTHSYDCVLAKALRRYESVADSVDSVEAEEQPVSTDRITRLEAENAELRKALEPFVRVWNEHSVQSGAFLTLEMFIEARDALKEEQPSSPVESGAASYTLTITRVPAMDELDEVVVYWKDMRAGEGEVLISCYGSAWTVYFGSMGDETIRQFFSRANTDYLVQKMLHSRYVKHNRAAENYLTRIVEAIKEHLEEEEDGSTFRTRVP